MRAQRKAYQRLKRRIALWNADVGTKNSTRPATKKPGSQNRHKTMPAGRSTRTKS